MTTSGSDWLLAQYAQSRARQLHASPADEWAAATAARDDAESRGDQQAVDEANRELDRLDAERREHAADASRAAGESMRFSSGIRTPLSRERPQGERMGEILVEHFRGPTRYGRTR
jgi:hypothetical protein